DLHRLARSVNLDTQQATGRLRTQVLNGLRELEARKYLETYEITEDNRVHTVKARHTALKIDVPIFGSRRLETKEGRD
ncbi:MAG: hypothetical protein ACWGNK_07120, partial [Desulfobacterales bacterium]